MKIYLEGSPDEINQILYGVHDDFEDARDDDEESAKDFGDAEKVTLNADAVAELIRNALENLKAKTN